MNESTLIINTVTDYKKYEQLLVIHTLWQATCILSAQHEIRKSLNKHISEKKAENLSNQT